ncbi:MAG: hypothetical protein IKE15_10975, partial [Clostridia bacterium]|nr:hypothetical protein [Clostridia bacterium]
MYPDDATFCIIKTSGEVADPAHLQGETVETSGGVLDGIRFTWDSEPTNGVITIHAKPVTDDVIVNIVKADGSPDISLNSGYYYLVVGWHDGDDSYAFKELNNALVGETFSCDTQALIQEGHPHEGYDSLFVLLKKYDSQESNPRPDDGSEHVVVMIPTIGGVGTYTNTLTLDGDQYTFTLSGPAENTDGKQEYTITVSRYVPPKHTVTLAAEDGVDTTYFCAVLRWNINGQDYYAFAEFANGTPQYFSTLENQNGNIPYDSNAQIRDAFIITADQYYYEYRNMLNNDNAKKHNAEYIGDKQVSIITQGDTTTFTIGNAVPPTYGATLSFTEGGTATTPDSLEPGYYLVAKDSDNNYYYAPVTSDGIGTFVYPDGHTFEDNKIPEAAELKFVQYIGDDASADALKDLEKLTALGKYEITYPESPTEGAYQFTANKPVPCTAEISFVDADDLPDETPALDAGYTYSVVAYNNGTEVGAAPFTGTGPLTFPEGTDINDTTTFKIRRVKDDTTEEIASGGKFGLYTFDWGNAEDTVYTITAKKDRIYTATLSFIPEENVTLGDDPYYVLVKGENNQYKYYAQVTDAQVTASGFDSFRDATGAAVTGMNGITGFEFVNAKGITVNGISDLTGLAKISDGGTIGEYYTISIPAEPTDTVYEFSATKQQNKYYMQYQSSDGNSIEGITLPDGTCYYLLASIDGTPAYYAALPGESYGDNPNPITFNTSDTNTTTDTLPNVSFAIKQSDSEAAGLQDVIDASEVLQIFDASGKKYALTYTTSHNRAVPPSEFDIIAKQVADENSVIIDFINNGRPDTNVTLSGNYYLVLKDNYNNKYYAPITVVGSQAVIHDFKNANNNGEAYTIPTDAATITYGKILKYSGSGEPSAQMIRDSYDSGSSQITTASTCSDGDSLELYDLTFDNQRANDQSFHITATKKVGYEVTVNFKNSDMSEPVTPGEGDAPAITESSWIRAGLFNGDSAEGRIGFAYASIQTSASTNYAILDSFTLDGGGTISYTDAKAAGYYVDGIRLVHSPYTTNAPTQYTDTSYSEADFDGYTFVYNRRNNWVDNNNKGDPKTATSNEILIRTSDPTEYHVKLDCGENGLTIPDGYDLYAKVTIDYQSNVKGYGFAKITNSDSHDGGKTFDVVISEWYDQQGAPVPGATISGHEMQMSVQLHVLPSNSPATHPSALTTGYDGNVMKIGDTVQTHTVVSYPVVQKDYVYDETAENPPRIIENIPGVKQVLTDVVYLDVPNDHFKLYSLEDVLDGGYNVVTLCYGPKGDEEFGADVGQGDAYIAKHQMGAVLIRGDLDIDENGDVSGLADSYDAINPSVVGGKMDNPNAGITGPFIHSRPTEYRQMLNKYGADTIVNTYLGSKNNVIGYYVNDQRHYAQDGGKDYGFNRAGATIISDDFVDWNRLQKNIVNASKSMAVNARDTVTPNDNGVVNVSPGDNIIVDITPGQQITINLVIPEGNTTPFEDLPGTVINFTGNDETMYVPYLKVNGDTLTTVENGKGISIVYNYPNCTHTVHSPSNGESEFGHVVAPKALIKFEGGNYSGTLIGNNAYIGSSAEGHLYPYNGGVLVGVYAEVDFGKILNDAAPTTQVFTFHMDRFEDTATAGEYNTNGNDAFWENEQNPKNSNGTIEFADIPFFNAGTYYFRIYEDTSVQKTGLTYDTTQYLMKVTIKSRIEIVNNISKTVLYIDKDGTQLYKVAEGKEDQLLTVSTDDTDPDNIIKIADIDIDSLLDANTISIVDGIEWGNYTTLHSNESFVNTMEDIDIAVPLTGTKSLEGKALEGNDFTFRVLDQNDNVVSTGKNNSSGTITFTPIGYKSDSVFAAGDTATEKTFTYKVVEVIPEGANEGNHYTYDGIRYDPSEKTIQVKVTRVFDETLGMWGDYQATLVQGLDSQEFENTYTGTLGDVQVTKAFSGVDNLPDNFQIVATYTVEGEEQSKLLTLGT